MFVCHYEVSHELSHELSHDVVQELTVQEERSQAVRVVNPLLVHVVLRATGGGEGGDGSLQRTNSHGLQQVSQTLSHLSHNPQTNINVSTINL